MYLVPTTRIPNPHTQLRVPTFCILYEAGTHHTTPQETCTLPRYPGTYIPAAKQLRPAPASPRLAPFPAKLSYQGFFLRSPPLSPLLFSPSRFSVSNQSFSLHHRYRRPSFRQFFQPFFSFFLWFSNPRSFLILCSHYGHRHSFRVHFIP